MPLTILHIAACLCLTAASLFWLLKHERKENAHQFLFPFILAAGILGSVLLYLRVMELFIVDYSGALYETDGHHLRATGCIGPSCKQVSVCCVFHSLVSFQVLAAAPC